MVEPATIVDLRPGTRRVPLDLPPLSLAVKEFWRLAEQAKAATSVEDKLAAIYALAGVPLPVASPIGEHALAMLRVPLIEELVFDCVAELPDERLCELLTAFARLIATTATRPRSPCT